MRRPKLYCMDCQQQLKAHFNFCPHCGQENTERQVGFKTLLGDFISNYFAVDSKLGRSIRHFFFRPGRLTQRFIEGKRVRYIHPVRLYLGISLLFFFVLSYMITAELDEATFQAFPDQANNTASNASLEINPVLGLPINPESSIEEIESIGSIDVIDSIENVESIDSSNTEGMATPTETEFEKGQGKFGQILNWLKDDTLTDEMVMDSLNSINIGEDLKSNETTRHFLHQGRRVVQKDLDVFIPYILKNLPIMMFILLPIFAAYLMFLFRNKPNLYISHIIHALHVHAMAFLLLSLFLLIGWATESYFFWSIFFLITLYAFLSIKNVYRQGWRRTGFKFLVLGGLYFNTLLAFIILEMAWSFFTF